MRRGAIARLSTAVSALRSPRVCVSVVCGHLVVVLCIVLATSCTPCSIVGSTLRNGLRSPRSMPAVITEVIHPYRLVGKDVSHGTWTLLRDQETDGTATIALRQLGRCRAVLFPTAVVHEVRLDVIDLETGQLLNDDLMTQAARELYATEYKGTVPGVEWTTLVARGSYQTASVVWAGVAGNVALVAVTLSLVIIAVIRVRQVAAEHIRTTRVLKQLCPSCGYPLISARVKQCPECGVSVN